MSTERRQSTAIYSLRQAGVGVWLTLLATSSLAQVIDISSEQLARLQAEGVPVIDIRTAPEWEQTGVVAGSHLLTFFDEKGKVDAPAFVTKTRQIAPPEKPVILICRTGNRTRTAGKFLHEQVGYGTVYNVKTGIFGWRKDAGAVVPAQPLLAACKAANTC